ncbi:cathelin-like [Echinops telfairi]|uniref:Cathelin-like n=1 Tax=Echinops telfairi TaxID=9371 RepID=A0ABM0INN1_ECHTE|nr:cathelin-like [Echinops telfairi]
MGGIRGPAQLLLLLLVGLTWAKPTEDLRLSQAEALAFAIDSYNTQSDEEVSAFQILEAEPQPDWDPALETPQPLNFIIKETNCKKAQKLPPEQCPFKDDGKIQKCVGLLKADADDLSVELTCKPHTSEGPVRVPRGLRKTLKKIGKKIKDTVKKLLPKKPIMIGYSKRF